MGDPAKLEEVAQWLLEGPPAVAPERLFSDIADKLLDAGIPLWRVAISLHTTDPAIRGFYIVWTRGAPLVLKERDHGIATSSLYVGTPVQRIIEGEVDEFRCRLDVPRAELPHVVLAELADAGGTDYLVCPLSSSSALPAAAGRAQWQRQWISFASDQGRGFSDDDVGALRRMVPYIWGPTPRG